MLQKQIKIQLRRISVSGYVSQLPTKITSRLSKTAARESSGFSSIKVYLISQAYPDCRSKDFVLVAWTLGEQVSPQWKVLAWSKETRQGNSAVELGRAGIFTRWGSAQKDFPPFWMPCGDWGRAQRSCDFAHAHNLSLTSWFSGFSSTCTRIIWLWAHLDSIIENIIEN